MPRIPDIPGFRVPRGSDQESWLKSQVARLCQLNDHRCVPKFLYQRYGSSSQLNPCRFPGSQPVSFSLNHLAELEHREYFNYSPFHVSQSLFIHTATGYARSRMGFVSYSFCKLTQMVEVKSYIWWVFLPRSILTWPPTPRRLTDTIRTTNFPDSGFLTRTDPETRSWTLYWTVNS